MMPFFQPTKFYLIFSQTKFHLKKTNSILTYSSDTLALQWDYEKDSSNQSNFSLNIVNYPSRYKKYNLIESIKNNNFNKNDVNLSINFKEISEQISLKVKIKSKRRKQAGTSQKQKDCACMQNDSTPRLPGPSLFPVLVAPNRA